MSDSSPPKGRGFLLGFSVTYTGWAKNGLLLSLAVLALGGAELGAAAMHVTLPAWEHTLFTDVEILGTLGMLLCPLTFGIVMPPTE